MEAQGYGGGLPEKSPAERARHARGKRLPPHAVQAPRGPHPLCSSWAAAEQQLLPPPLPPPDPWDARVRLRRSLGLRKTRRGAAYLRTIHGRAAVLVASLLRNRTAAVGEENGLEELCINRRGSGGFRVGVAGCA